MIALTLQTEIDGIQADVDLTIGPASDGSLMLTVTHATFAGVDPFGLVDTKAESGIAATLTARGIAYTRISDREFGIAVNVPGWKVRITG
jgi:hypothetical protein